MTSARRAGSNPRRPQPEWGPRRQRARPARASAGPQESGEEDLRGATRLPGLRIRGSAGVARAGGRGPQHPAGVEPDPRALSRTRNAARLPPWPAVAAVAPRLPRHAGAQPGAQPREQAVAYQRRCAPHLPRSLRRLPRRSACSSRWPAAHGQGRSEPGAQRPCRGARRLKRHRPAGASRPLPQSARRSARREPLAAGLVLAPEAVRGEDAAPTRRRSASEGRAGRIDAVSAEGKGAPPRSLRLR